MNLSVPSRRTLVRHVHDLYDIEKNSLIEELKSIKYVSCTADMWSSHKQGFLGMTVYYVDPNSLLHRSHALTCRRFQYSHTGESIAIMTAEILKEFNLIDRIVGIVTDNAANMVKEF